MTIENDLYEVVEKAKKYDQLIKIQGVFQELICSFCFKNQDQVNKLIAGKNVYICNECVNICNTVLNEENNELRTK